MTPLFDQEDEYIELPPERSTLPKVAVVLAILVAVLAVVGVGARSWYQNQVDPPGTPGAKVNVDVARGATINGVGSTLADRGVIGNATVFRFWVRDKDVKVLAGTYVFRKRSSFAEAIDVLDKGPAPPPVTRVTVPEGLTLAQMSDRLAEGDPRFSKEAVGQALADPAIRSKYQPADQTSLEGLVFPSTYDISDDDDAHDLVTRMVSQMDIEGTRLGIDQGVQGGSAPQLSPYQVLTVASLIQAEAGSPEEGPKIARVIYNRLLDDMPLGIDATSRYLAAQTGQAIDFESDSPYNTRRQRGLPPTPIGGPGEAAISAALHPAEGDWLYYVLEAKGRHFFTASEDEFIQKKQECEDKGLGCG